MKRDTYMLELKVGVRQLIESVCREGGLLSLQFNSISGQEGTHLHRLFFQKLDQLFPDIFYRVEQSLQGKFTLEDVSVQVQGRADVCLEIDGEQQILEAKSYNGSLKSNIFKGEEIHWAQALLYTCLLHAPQAQGGRRFTYRLAYLSIEAAEPLLLERQIDEAQAYLWLQDLLRNYIRQARSQQEFLEARDRTLRQLRFPFEQLRPGQKELMEACLRAIQQRLPLIAQAPTGTGKTMSNLYPALKAQGKHLIGKIFYLTAKVATRQVAADALQILRNKGLLLRSIILKAKEQICLCPELYCDTKLCPYAVSYYDHLPAALSKALAEVDLKPDFIQEIAKEFSVCPFELSLDLSLLCDVIIGDYSHFFDPRIRLIRFFEENREQHLILLDEAHNLPSRTVEMFSASLSLQTLYRAKQQIENFDSSLAEKMQRLIQYFAHLAQSLKKDSPGFSRLEPKIEDKMVIKAAQFRAVRSPLPHLRRFLFSLIPSFRHCLDQIEDHKIKRPILDFYFELLFFVRVQDEFWNDSYITIFEHRVNDVHLRLRCQDSSPMLLKAFQNKHIPIFFSATLNPLPYYQAMFSDDHADHRPDVLSMASPFPQENLLILIYDQLKTRYQERTNSMPEAARIISAATTAKHGNYLVYFPSYAYLEKVKQELSQLPELQKIQLLVQKPNMSEAQKEAFLQPFMQPKEGETTIGLAVLGGSFGEGIDLVGDRLTGVIIIGVGLPQMNPERTILQSYFDYKLQQGFNFAYLYPAFTKILQAAGRVIRSENDIGFVLLCDERYIKAEYRMLLPEEWKPWRVQSAEVVHKALQKFYRDCGLPYRKDEQDIRPNHATNTYQTKDALANEGANQHPDKFKNKFDDEVSDTCDDGLTEEFTEEFGDFEEWEDENEEDEYDDSLFLSVND